MYNVKKSCRRDIYNHTPMMNYITEQKKIMKDSVLKKPIHLVKHAYTEVILDHLR